MSVLPENMHSLWINDTFCSGVFLAAPCEYKAYAPRSKKIRATFTEWKLPRKRNTYPATA